MAAASSVRMRNLVEVSVPGAATGVVAGLAVGGMALLVGQPATWAATGALVLGLPLALLGGGYGMLVGAGLVRPGVFAPAALYWLVGFPLARLLHETVPPALLGGGLTPPENLLGFLAYQALVSLGFAIGFIWLLERLMPHWLDRIRAHNPDAQRVYELYTAYAEMVWQARERRRARRKAGTSGQVTAARTPARRS